MSIPAFLPIGVNDRHTRQSAGVPDVVGGW